MSPCHQFSQPASQPTIPTQPNTLRRLASTVSNLHDNDVLRGTVVETGNQRRRRRRMFGSGYRGGDGGGFLLERKVLHSDEIPLCRGLHTYLLCHIVVVGWWPAFIALSLSLTLPPSYPSCELYVCGMATINSPDAYSVASDSSLPPLPPIQRKSDVLFTD